MAPIVSREELAKAPRLQQFSPVYKIDPKTVVKTGKIVRMAEAEAMKFVRANTSIPVPQVRNAYRDDSTGEVVIVMDYVEGESLDKAWEKYTNADRDLVISQLRG